MDTGNHAVDGRRCAPFLHGSRLHGNDLLTQQFLHRSGCQGISLSRGPHVQRLMWTPVVVIANPVGDHLAGMLQCLEAVPMHALVFEGSDHSQHRIMRGSSIDAQPSPSLFFARFKAETAHTQRKKVALRYHGHSVLAQPDRPCPARSPPGIGQPAPPPAAGSKAICLRGSTGIRTASCCTCARAGTTRRSGGSSARIQRKTRHGNPEPPKSPP